jgi:hypothetical protein
MKKILFLMSFFMVAGLTVNAQSCSKTCSKTCSKAKTASVESAEGTSVASAFMVADEAANANEMIEKRVCSKSGSVAYYEKSVCSASGKVSFDEVKYCTDSKKFVNVSPLDAAADTDASVIKTSEGATKKACSAAEKKACSKMSKEECSKKCTGKKATGV